VAAAYLTLALGMAVGLAWAARRRRLRGSPAALRGIFAAAAVALLGIGLVPLVGPGSDSSQSSPGLRVSVLDIGQGDAILLDPVDGDPVLVDGGPPGDDLRSKLLGDGVTRIAAVIVTHDEADHVGGIAELLGGIPIHRLLYARPSRDFLGPAQAAGVRARSIFEGASVVSGSLRLQVLWPPRSLLGGQAPDDPNTEALVLVARWHRFSILLTADAEAEAVPIDPCPVDVLKVAHHGSDDAGLGPLLDHVTPRLAVISVGEDNPYGHPTAKTISTLAEHRVPTLRTDFDGEVTIDVTRRGWAASVGG
jgi:competence protein ComEC